MKIFRKKHNTFKPKKANTAIRFFVLFIMNALLWGLAYHMSQGLVETFIGALFSSALLAVSLTDIKHMVIPDKLTGFILILAVFSLFLTDNVSVLDGISGLLIGGGILYAAFAMSLKLLNKEGIGGGDIKLMGACGLMLGAMNTFLALFLASFMTLIFISVKMMFGKKTSGSMDYLNKIPFGPALSAGSIICYYFGEDIVRWYTELF